MKQHKLWIIHKLFKTTKIITIATNSHKRWKIKTFKDSKLLSRKCKDWQLKIISMVIEIK